MPEAPSSASEKVAIVVGGGSGIGAACVREFAANGYRVVAMSPSGRARALAESLGGAGLDGSNTSVEDLRACVDLAVSRYGRVDAVVNSSGHAARGPVLEITDEQWSEGVDLYLLNVVRMARLVTPHLIASGGGAIVNISTAGAFEPGPMFPVSVTMRAALASFTKLYANEYGPQGIRMNNVLTGLTKDDPSVVPAEWTRGIPLRRAQSTAEAARIVRFLAAEESAYMTGQNIRVDGGETKSV
ncbi:SDR family oxidoreductase [Streptomyces sp. PSKA54]|uniref:SDR family oxidoreductase n=1 Tax=Streptomyces himalayensis subsp. aureolus TaxID=2758039 RepID=A0A7W2HKE1_9ACTN|nr:SDR family oxidoreductase [Streptomyces himalayensis]MBA4867090.1 SDR family oxidoreductase [Streptomyces himalayensis subsp. aureolus]